MKTLVLIATVSLASCAGEMTPEQARQAAEAARAWVEVAKEARTIIITDDK